MSIEVTPVVQRSKGPMLVFLRVAAIGCIVALAILALLPAPIVTRTGLGGHAEHLIAYLGTAIVIGLAFQESPRLIVQCTMLIVYAVALEAGQFYSPGRHASLQDLAFSAAGVLIGGLFLLVIRTRVLAPRNLTRQHALRAHLGGEIGISSDGNPTSPFVCSVCNGRYQTDRHGLDTPPA